MDNAQNIANTAYNMDGYYDRNLLQEAVPEFNYMRFANVRDLPTGNTDILKLRRYNLLGDITTPLVEGVTPAGSKMTYDTLQVQVKQYGDYILVTDWVDWTHEDAILTEIVQKQGSQAGSSLDSLMGTVLINGTNVLFSGVAVERSQVTAKWTSAMAREGVRILKNQLAKPMTSMVSPSQNYGTKSISPAYIGFIHPDTTKELKLLAQTDNAVTLVKDYARPDLALPNEVCAIDEIRMIESTKAKIAVGEGDGGKDVYLDVIVSKDSYFATRISGKALQNIRKPFGAGDDPLNQRGTSGWKSTFVGGRTQEGHVLRVEHSNV